MRATALALVVLGITLLLTDTTAAGHIRNVDCDCWDISVVGVDGKGKHLLLENQGVLGWNVYEVSPDRKTIVL